jgi:hypothetical protein
MKSEIESLRIAILHGFYTQKPFAVIQNQIGSLQQISREAGKANKVYFLP